MRDLSDFLLIKRRAARSSASALGIMCLMPFLAMPATAGNTTYQYDALGRVVKVTYPDAKQVCYSYDPAGNRYLVQRQATGACTPTAVTVTTTSLAAGSTNQATVSEASETAGADNAAGSVEAIESASTEEAVSN